MYRCVKRILDFCVALVMLIILSPLMLIVAVSIKICDDGEVLFRQQRPGKNGKVFTVYKFRTMKSKTHENGKALSDMERITRIGSFLRATSLDEIPQMINVLKGDMSIVGPRPLLVEYIEKYDEHQMRRHEVLPGITGWAQVNGRNAISWEERFELDVWYVDNMNLILDIKIVFRTVANIVKRDGINSGEGITMEHFTGSEKSKEVLNIR